MYNCTINTLQMYHFVRSLKSGVSKYNFILLYFLFLTFILSEIFSKIVILRTYEKVVKYFRYYINAACHPVLDTGSIHLTIIAYNVNWSDAASSAA